MNTSIHNSFTGAIATLCLGAVAAQAQQTETRLIEGEDYAMLGRAVAAIDDIAVATSFDSVWAYRAGSEGDWSLPPIQLIPDSCGRYACTGVSPNEVALGTHEAWGYRIAMVATYGSLSNPRYAVVTYQGNGRRWFTEGAAATFADDVHAIALHDDVMVLATSDSSGVFSYRRVGSGWQLDAVLSGPWTASGATPGDLSLDGNRLVVGVPADGDGSVYVYDLSRRSDGSLSFAYDTALTPGNSGNPYSDFGYSVASDGHLIVVGASYENAAYVFADRGWDWHEEARLTHNGGSQDAFGMRVAIDGNVVAVSAPFEDTAEGAVHVFSRMNWFGAPFWIPGDKLSASDGFVLNALGLGLAIAGDAVIAGAPNRVNHSGNYAGAVYMFGCATTRGGC